jgi:hypothetical protein
MIGVVGMPRPVLTPVLAMAVGPGPLRLTLIGAVIGVARDCQRRCWIERFRVWPG